MCKNNAVFTTAMKFLFFLGSVIGSHFHRQLLAALVYSIDIVALIFGFAIVKPNPTLIGVSVGIILLGFVFFGFLSYLGHRLMQNVTKDVEVVCESRVSDAPNQTIDSTYRDGTELQSVVQTV